MTPSTLSGGAIETHRGPSGSDYPKEP